jgi:hypothetical protein
MMCVLAMMISADSSTRMSEFCFHSCLIIDY